MAGDASTDAFVAHFSPWRRVAGLAGAAGFVALGLWLAGAIGQIEPPMPWVGYPCAAVFAVFFAIGLIRTPSRGEAVRVDDAGVWIWRADGGVTVPWTAIVDVVERRVHGQPFLCLWLDDADRYRSPALRGGVASANTALGFGDVSIGVQGTDRRFAELVVAFERFGGGWTE